MVYIDNNVIYIFGGC
ncbi:hypothetical protein [Mammaliicoccus sciuri]